MKIDERIAQRYPELSPGERRTADAMLERLADLGTYRAAELAELAGVSKATMSRLIRRLGYDDFEKLREELRERRAEGVPMRVFPSADRGERIRHEADALSTALAGIEESDLESAANQLVQARRVVIIGLRTSHAVALYLRQQLAQLREDVVLLPHPGQSLGEDLVGLTENDLVVLVAHRRRPPQLSQVAAALAAQAVPILLLADPTARRLAEHTTWWFVCPLSSVGVFDSFAPTMAVVSLLSDQVAAVNAMGTRRAALVDTFYQEIGETEPR